MAVGRRFGGSAVMISPSRTMPPASGRRKPPMSRSKVVLPHPLGPTKDTSSPWRMAALTLSRAVTAPYRLVRPSRPKSGRSVMGAPGFTSGMGGKDPDARSLGEEGQTHQAERHTGDENDGDG